MKIKIYCIGKIKEQYLKDGINEYIKRISAYANVEIIEVADSKVKDNPNNSDIEKAKNEEGERVLKQLKNDYLIGLDLNKKDRKTYKEYVKSFTDCEKAKELFAEDDNFTKLLGEKKQDKKEDEFF